MQKKEEIFREIGPIFANYTVSDLKKKLKAAYAMQAKFLADYQKALEVHKRRKENWFTEAELCGYSTKEEKHNSIQYQELQSSKNIVKNLAYLLLRTKSIIKFTKAMLDNPKNVAEYTNIWNRV